MGVARLTTMQVWVDNFIVYDNASGFMALGPEDLAALQDSKMAFMRTHSTQRIYTMDMLTSPANVVGHSNLDALSPQTLPWLLSLMRQTGLQPWIQVLFGMAEAEWVGLVEYLVAPYDPAVDSPGSKPWAYKRAVLQASSSGVELVFYLVEYVWSGGGGLIHTGACRK